MPRLTLAARLVALALAIVPGVAPSTSEAAEAVRFGTNWFAEPEHGGFYQARG